MSECKTATVIYSFAKQRTATKDLQQEVMLWNGRPVVATARIRNDLGFSELLDIWQQFYAWKEEKERFLPKDEQIFQTEKNGHTVWVIEDAEALTILYPEEY